MHTSWTSPSRAHSHHLCWPRHPNCLSCWPLQKNWSNFSNIQVLQVWEISQAIHWDLMEFQLWYARFHTATAWEDLHFTDGQQPVWKNCTDQRRHFEKVAAFLKLFKDAANDLELDNPTSSASFGLLWSRLIEHCQAASLNSLLSEVANVCAIGHTHWAQVIHLVIHQQHLSTWCTGLQHSWYLKCDCCRCWVQMQEKTR